MTVNRVDAPVQAGEREMLTAWLDYQRATLAMKCDGLAAAQLRRREVPPSSLSLLGLVRHMAEVERAWFRRRLAGEDARFLYVSERNWNAEFDDVDTADADEAFRTWEAECEAARKLTDAAGSLDDLAKSPTGERENFVSLRWILVHMIEEYARHNGHADLIRERIDGATGD
jgi:uncharacterized damage-inducible protein DinB